MRQACRCRWLNPRDGRDRELCNPTTVRPAAAARLGLNGSQSWSSLPLWFTKQASGRRQTRRTLRTMKGSVGQLARDASFAIAKPAVWVRSARAIETRLYEGGLVVKCGWGVGLILSGFGGWERRSSLSMKEGWLSSAVGVLV